jgi:hypothetical protein
MLLLLLLLTVTSWLSEWAANTMLPAAASSGSVGEWLAVKMTFTPGFKL